MQKKIAILSLFILILLLLLTGVWALFFKKDKLNISNNSNTISKENITLTYKYLGTNKWEYQVKGELPNPCHKVNIEPFVAESYPEQVTVVVNIKEELETGTVCTQVIQALDMKGNFNASEKAEINLQINKE